MNKYMLIIFITLTGCTTPTTVLKNEQGQVVQCGGNVSSSMAGGAIGYHIQKSNDQECVDTYKENGFEIIDVKL